MRRRGLVAAGGAIGLAGAPRARAARGGTLRLTIDTGSMVPAERIAAVLKAHGIHATFFLANEPTARGDHALDTSWAPFWRARAAEGHAFGSHTWRHWTLREDLADGTIRYAAPAWITALGGGGPEERLDEAGLARELARPGEAFAAMTGRPLDPLWRAPAGRTTPRALAWAQARGLRHVGWTEAGFLGDELDSAKFPNRLLLERALAHLRDGDVLLLHLGTRSRVEPFVEIVEPLLAGLLERGFRFVTWREAAA